MNCRTPHTISRSATNFLLALLLMILLNPAFGHTQDDEASVFDNTLNALKSLKPTRYSAIDSLFRTYSSDSIKMKTLIQTANKMNYLEGESYALNALGVIYRNVSYYERSIETHKKAKVLADESDNNELKVVSLNNIGVAYRRMDLVKPALDYHTKALDISRSIENPSETISYNIAVSQNSIGNIYLILEQYDLATKQFQKSLVIEKKSGNRLGMAINYQNIGYAYEATWGFRKCHSEL